MSLWAREGGIAERFAAWGAEWLPGEPLSRHTSLGVGGPADILRVHDTRRVPELVAYLEAQDVPWRILGGGSNLLVADEGAAGRACCIWRRGVPIEFAGHRVVVPAATTLGTAILACAKRNLGGMEGLVGVPGTLGGALRMNAGSYGTEMAGVARALTLFKGETRQVESVKADSVGFEYRHTNLSSHDLVLSVTLELLDRPQSEVLERVKEYNRKRRAAQPLQEESAGCMFKNPPGHSAGKMIASLGLNGMRLGGAVVSERHANFIVNRYHAKAADILKLMDLVRERVLKAYGLELEEEVVIWKD